jgi:hypothetical protein
MTNPEPFELSPDELTLGDLEDIETVLGCPMESATEPGKRLRLSSAMIWVRRRKVDPAFTFDDARALPISFIESITGELLGTDESEEPAQLPDPTIPRRIAV